MKSLFAFLLLASVASAANLVPGPGFSGPTAQPPNQGDSGSPFYNTPVAARWSMVPYQTFSGSLSIGVVAFQATCISRVEFSANGGPWLSISTPSVNPDTGITEFVATAVASEFNDSQIEIRAVVYPNTGVPRILGTGGTASEGGISMLLNANSGSTLPATVRYVSTSGSDGNNGLTPGTAFATISAARNSINTAQGGDVGGGIIKLLAGSYPFGSASETSTFTAATQWLTIQPNDGVAASAVTLTAGLAVEGIRTTKVRVNALTVTQTLNSGGIGDGDELWLSNIIATGANLMSDNTPGAWNYKYITDSTVSTFRRFLSGFTLIRSTPFDNIGESGYHDSAVVINCVASNCVRGDPGYHPDVYQFTAEQKNFILYGFTATTNIDDTFGIRMQPSADVGAMVNTNFTMGTGSIYLWELERPYSNLFIYNGTWNGQFVYDGTFSADNVIFDTITFPTGSPGAATGVTFRTVGCNVTPPPSGGDATVAGTTTVTTTLTLP